LYIILTEFRITSVEMRFMRRAEKYTWQDHKNNEDSLSQLKITPAVKKIQKYRNKWIGHVRWMDSDRLPPLVMEYQPCRKWRHGHPLKRLLNC
jgi:hypothetical protein